MELDVIYKLVEAAVAQVTQVTSSQQVVLLPQWAVGVIGSMLFAFGSLIWWTWRKQDNKLDALQEDIRKLDRMITALPDKYKKRDDCKIHLDKQEEFEKESDRRIRSVELKIASCRSCQQSSAKDYSIL